MKLKIWRPRSIYTCMFLVLCATAIPTFLGLSFYVYQQRAYFVEFSKENAQRFVELAAHDENWLFRSTHDVLKAVEASPVFRNADWVGCHEFMARMLEEKPAYRDMGVFSPNGDALCSGTLNAEDLKPYNFKDREYFERILNEPDLVISQFHIGRISKSPIILVATASRDEAGTPQAIIYASLDATKLADTGRTHSMEPGASIFLLDRNNVVIKSAPDASLAGAPLKEKVIAQLIAAQPKGSATVRLSDGSQMLISHARTGTLQDPHALTILYQHPTWALFDDINRHFWIGAIATLLLMFLALTLGWWGLQTFIGRNILYLTEAAKRLGERNFATRVANKTSGTEFKQIGLQFDKMAHELDEQQQQWETSLLQRKAEVQILRLIADDRPLDEVLHALVHFMQGQLSHTSVSVVLLDEARERIETCVAPDLPAACNDLIDGALLTPELGWHATAILLKRVVITQDISTDLQWERQRELAIANNLHASWSYPIVAADDAVLGAIGVYCQTTHTPTLHELSLSKMAAELASVAINQRRKTDILNFQSRHDYQTGLYNRSTLSTYISEAIHEASADKSKFYVLMLDLDGFKEINDTLGHDMGDTLLVLASRRLLDTVADEGYVARAGNDEFLFLLRPQHHTIEQMARTLVDAIRKPFLLHDVQVQISASVGIATYPEDATELNSLVRYADSAMYRARSEGTGVEFHQAKFSESASNRLVLLSDLRRALHEQEFILHYQPIIDLASGRATGVEALIRWQHPESGLLYPSQFISAIELSDLIHPLTVWIIEQAVRQCAFWRQRGHAVTVAANVSARNLLQVGFPGQIQEILTRHRFPPQALRLEITESSIMTDLSRSLDVLDGLRDIGVYLAIDDFGTGHSALAYLQKLPVDNLKIDRSFIARLAQDHDARSIVVAIIKLAHKLNISVTAEGVDSEAALNVLRTLECDFAQGYHISRPMEATHVPAWLDEKARLNRSDG